MKRKGLRVSLHQLTKLFMELYQDQEDLNKELKMDNIIDFEREFVVGIINKEGLSDTWELEE